MNVEDNVFMFAIPLISKLFFNQLWILSSVILHIAFAELEVLFHNKTLFSRGCIVAYIVGGI